MSKSAYDTRMSKSKPSWAGMRRSMSLKLPSMSNSRKFLPLVPIFRLPYLARTLADCTLPISKSEKLLSTFMTPHSDISISE